MSSGLRENIKVYRAEAADLSGKYGHFVKAGSSKDQVLLCGNGEKAIGVIQSHPEGKAGEAVEVAMLGAGAFVKLGAGVSFGDSISSDAAGKAKVAVNDEWAAGILMETGVTDDLIGANLQPHYAFVPA